MKTLNLNERTFGIEIEFFGVTREKVAEALRDAGINAEIQGYNHIDSQTTWKLITDASVNGEGCGNYGGKGNEIVSPILKGEEGFRQLEIVCRVLNKLGAKVDKSCGLHVHFGTDDLKLTHWKNICFLYYKYQDSIDSILPKSRRTSSYNNYCLPLSARNISDIESAQTLEQLARAFDRYHVINVEAYLRHGTIEFRQHSGTIDYEKISNWIHLLMALINSAKQSRLVNPYGLKDELNWLGFTKKLISGGMDISIREYYIERRRKFRKQEAA